MKIAGIETGPCKRVELPLFGLWPSRPGPALFVKLVGMRVDLRPCGLDTRATPQGAAARLAGRIGARLKRAAPDGRWRATRSPRLADV